jgi:hypothetical protein
MDTFVASGNSGKGRMVDQLTRDDGMTASCQTKTVEFKKSVALSSSDLNERWRAVKRQEWNAIHCSDKTWAAMASSGWQIVAAVTTTNREEIKFVVECR